MKYIFDTDDVSVIGPIPDLAKPASTVFRKTFAEMAQDTHLIDSFSTGLLPVHGSGLLSYRRAFNYEQIIFQLEPGISTVKWGNYENDPSAQLFELAMPYRIIISDYQDNAFVGSRHFFSMQPIYHWDAPLYATGFSNTNNLGYGETSIGWICHYHNGAGNNIADLAGKIEYMVWRESGLAEPYNYGNMSGTDGPTFYKKFMPDKKHFHRADNWAEKTKKDGLDWVFDESNFIRYHTIVSDVFYASSHVNPATEESVDYTLRHASFNNYAPYYHHKAVKPINATGVDLDKFLTFLRPKSSTGSVASYTPANVSDVDAFEIPQFNDQTKDHFNKLVKGIPCNGCGNPFPSAQNFKEIITDIAYDEDLKQYVPSIISLYCKECTEEYTTLHSLNPQGPLFFVSTNCLIWDDFNSMWIFPHESIQCSNCETLFYDKSNLDLFFIYGMSLESNSGCISCLDSDTYTIDYVSKKNVLNHYLVSKDMISFESDSDGHPLYKIAKQYVHINYSDNVCKCGIYVQNSDEFIPKENENDPSTCVTCVHKTLISLETITAVAIEQKEVI